MSALAVKVGLSWLTVGLIYGAMLKSMGRASRLASAPSR
jgi:hypothetical protein